MKDSTDKLETMIYTIRGHRVMLDKDLAELYEMDTSRLNEAVRRNLERFPGDFLIIPDLKELSELRSQIAILEGVSSRNLVFRYSPHLFTENGVAMLSSVLNSKSAIQINITIMRTFTKMRGFLTMDDSSKDIKKLNDKTNQLFKVVFERLDHIDEILEPRIPANRNKIGLKADKKND